MPTLLKNIFRLMILDLLWRLGSHEAYVAYFHSSAINLQPSQIFMTCLISISKSCTVSPSLQWLTIGIAQMVWWRLLLLFFSCLFRIYCIIKFGNRLLIKKSSEFAVSINTSWALWHSVPESRSTSAIVPTLWWWRRTLLNFRKIW